MGKKNRKNNYNYNDNYNYYYGYEENNVPKKKKKKKFKFKFLILMIIIAFLGLFFYKKYNKEIYLPDQLNTTALNSKFLYEDLSEEELDKDYDKDGLTNREEIKLGTDMYNPDTDGDGIYDGTEINMYKIDPLKYSTSGDSFSDMSKIDAGLNPTKKVNKWLLKEQTIVDKDTNITLRTKDLDSLSKYIVKEVKLSNIDFEISSTPIKVSDFIGEIEIPLKSTDSNTKLYYYNEYNKKLTEIKDAKIKDTVATVDIKKNNPLPIIASNVPDSLSQNNLDFSKIDGKFAIVKTDIFKTAKIVAKILNVGSSELDESKDFVFVLRLSDKKSHIKADRIKSNLDISSDYNFYYIETKSEGIYNAALDLLNKITTIGDSDVIQREFVEIKQYTTSLDKLFDLYKTDTNIAISNKETTEKKEDNRESLFGKTYNVSTNFNLQKDAFSFANFSVDGRQVGGHCAGYAFVTSRTYNSDFLKDNYSYSELEKDLKYNLDNSYSQQINRKGTIYDFKLEGEKDNHYYYLNELKNNDIQALKYIELYFELSNDEVFSAYYKKDSYITGVVGIEGLVRFDVTGRKSNIKSLADEIENKFSNDKIVSFAMLTNSHGHAVNGYSMKTNELDPNIIDIQIYDNNYPNSQAEIQGQGVSDISDRVQLRLMLKEEKKNIMGIKKTVVSEKFLYNVPEGFYNDPYEYTTHHYGNIGTKNVDFHLTGNHLLLLDESKVNLD